MTRNSFAVLALTLFAFLIGTLRLHADEQASEISLADCPKAVQKTLKRESRRGTIEEVEREVEDGKTIYEAEVILAEKEYEVEVAEDGTLLSKILADEESENENTDDDEHTDDDDDSEEEVEVEIQLSDCPKGVQRTFKRESRGGKLEDLTKETEGKRTVYEAEVEIDGIDYEIEVLDDGTLLKKAIEEEDDEEEQDDDDDGDDNDE